MKLFIKSISLINDNDELNFINRIINEFNTLTEENINKLPSIILFPEYCWGNLDQDIIHSIILKTVEVIEQINFPILAVFGTAVIDNQNQAIVYNSINKKISYIPKVHALKYERENREVIPGTNNDSIEWMKLKIITVICADLWDTKLLMRLMSFKPDILLVPAYTAVMPGLSDYAKIQWYSLAISRSREFIVPIIIADHPNKKDSKYEVGNATCIVDPSLKNEKMHKLEDFLLLPINGIASGIIDTEKINEYREYRTDLGILS